MLIRALLLAFTLSQATGSLAPPRVPAVTTADELTAALLKGGPVLMAPGTFAGNFVISKPTVLTGSGQATTIIVPKDLLEPPLSGTADDITVQDLTIRNGAPDRDTLVFGTIGASSVDALPKRVRLQRITVTAVNGGHRGVLLNGTDMTLTESTVTGFWEKGRDSQAVAIVNGPGPYTITNNVLEASGENLLVGGADPGISGSVPSDITIRGNTFRKPASYRGLGDVKNLLELKNARRVAIENNTFDGNWADAQPGNAILFTVRNQSGKCAWCVVDDVVFRGNVVTNAVDGFGISILGSDDERPSQQTRKITIDRNLFADSPMGVQVINGVSEALIITNNTFPKVTNKFFQFDSSSGRPKVITPLTYSRNVTRAGEYGIAGDGAVAMGLPSLLQFATVVEWNGNVIEHGAGRRWTYPSGTGNKLLAPGGLAPLLDPKTFKLLSGTAGY
jgi:hypothetical protein